MSLSIGSRFGAYEITASLGAGGIGEVYRARDTIANRDVAIKVLPAGLAFEGDRLARFEREVQTLVSLSHPHIAGVYGLARTGGTRGIVEEFVDGETLEERLARAPFPREEALKIASDVAQALEAAHERGITHRDLRPANIKIAANGTIKILDVGFAQAISGDAPPPDLTDSPTASLAGKRRAVVLGMVAYMSPEQAWGRVIDARSDIWAFGCLLFELLSGRRAFEGSRMTDVLKSIATGQPNWTALPADTPPGIRRLLKRCIATDRKQRLRHIGDARLAIEDADAPTSLEPLSGVDLAAAAAAARSQAPSRWAIALAGLVVLAIIIAAACPMVR